MARLSINNVYKVLPAGTANPGTINILKKK